MPAFQYTVATASSRDLGIRLEVRPLSDILTRRRDLLQQDVGWLDACNLKLEDPASTALHVCFVEKEGQVNQKNNLLDTADCFDVRERQLSENDWILCVNDVRGPDAILEFLSTRAQDGKKLWLHFVRFSTANGPTCEATVASVRFGMIPSLTSCIRSALIAYSHQLLDLSIGDLKLACFLNFEIGFKPQLIICNNQ